MVWGNEVMIMNMILTTICGKARTDRAPIYYIRPMLDVFESYVTYMNQQLPTQTKMSLIVWSWGYFKKLLLSLGIDSWELSPETIARRYFDGDRWLHDRSFFRSPNSIQAREPLLYAVWLAKAYVMHELLSHDNVDAVVWMDCAYRVSYKHHHNIDEYIRFGDATPNWARFMDTVHAWLSDAQVVLAGSDISHDVCVENVDKVRPLAGCFIAVRRDSRDYLWESLVATHTDLVEKKCLSTDEAMWALACKEIATVRSFQDWDTALYGSDY